MALLRAVGASDGRGETMKRATMRARQLATTVATFAALWLTAAANWPKT